MVDGISLMLPEALGTDVGGGGHSAGANSTHGDVSLSPPTRIGPLPKETRWPRSDGGSSSPATTPSSSLRRLPLRGQQGAPPPHTPRTPRHADVLTDSLSRCRGRPSVTADEHGLPSLLRGTLRSEDMPHDDDERSPDACVICLEPLCEEDVDDDDLLPYKVPSAVSLPCACQSRLDNPARVHEACLRSWFDACQRRALQRPSEERAQEAVTCPLCRAPLAHAVSKALELAARARVALAQCPHAFATRPLRPSDGVIKCVVKVHDKHPGPRGSISPQRVAPGVQAEAPLLLSLYVESDEFQDAPLLVARAPKVLGSSRLATKFDILFGVRPEDPTETPAAVIARNCLGTRWTVSDPPSAAPFHKRRCTVDYEANRFANRPRAMHIELDDGKRKLRSRAPEYSPRLHGFCLDFFGRARLASVRNFQIVDADAELVPGDEETRCLLLFGRWSSEIFHLDVKAPFSLVDAFAIAVSSFATKIATI